MRTNINLSPSDRGVFILTKGFGNHRYSISAMYCYPAIWMIRVSWHLATWSWLCVVLQSSFLPCPGAECVTTKEWWVWLWHLGLCCCFLAWCIVSHGAAVARTACSSMGRKEDVQIPLSLPITQPQPFVITCSRSPCEFSGVQPWLVMGWSANPSAQALWSCTLA